MTKPSNIGKSSDEIDIIAILASIVRISTQNKKFIISCCVLGLAAGISLAFVMKSFYVSKMLLVSRFVKADKVAIILEPIIYLVHEKNDKELSVLLNLKPETCKKIRQVEIKPLKDELTNDREEITFKESYVQVIGTVNDASLFDSLSRGIEYYYTHNAFLKDKTATMKKQILGISEAYEKEILDLDSIKLALSDKVILQRKGGSESMANFLLPSAISLDMTEMKENYVMYKSYAENFFVVTTAHPFTHIKEPAGPNKPLIVLGALLFSFVLGVGFIVIRNRSQLGQ